MKTNNQFKIACAQMCSTRDPEKNLNDALNSITEAKQQGAEYIQTPEMTNIMTRSKSELNERCQIEKDNFFLDAMKESAHKNRIFVHIGSMAIKLDENKFANRGYIISPDGKILTRYDKIHMFDVMLSDQEKYFESSTYRSGEKAVIAHLNKVNIAMAICYDLRFANLFRTYAQNGADILSLPAAFTQTTGEAHWHILVRARAIENATFLIAAAQNGFHEDGRETYGHSLVVSPWGEIIAEKKEGTGILMATLDLNAIEQSRAKIPSLKHDKAFQLGDL